MLKEKLPGNVTYLKRNAEQDEEYPKCPIDAGRKFDIIVIDGRRHEDCARSCVNALSDEGVAVWDNSERSEYENGKSFLEGGGF